MWLWRTDVHNHSIGGFGLNDANARS
jgi:hypothetical protein